MNYNFFLTLKEYQMNQYFKTTFYKKLLKYNKIEYY